MPENNRRTNFERVQAIFQFIATQNGVFPKSRLKEIGLSPSAAESWLSIIEYIQAMPKIRLIKSNHITLIEKVEGKYQSYIRKKFTDETIPVEQRIQLGNDYIRSLYIRERAGLEKQPHNPEKITETITANAYFQKIKELCLTLSSINPLFDDFLHELITISRITEEDQRNWRFSKFVRQMMEKSALHRLREQLHDKSYIHSRIKEIERYDPEYRHKFDQALKFLDAQQ